METMACSTKLDETATRTMHLPTVMLNPLRVELLTDSTEAEVLDFLGARPIHTVVMAGFIRDNGLATPLNRCPFFRFLHSIAKLNCVPLFCPLRLVWVRPPSPLPTIFLLCPFS